MRVMMPSELSSTPRQTVEGARTGKTALDIGHVSIHMQSPMPAFLRSHISYGPLADSFRDVPVTSFFLYAIVGRIVLTLRPLRTQWFTEGFRSHTCVGEFI